MSPRKSLPTVKTIQVSAWHWKQMRQHIESLPEEEVCGILGGRAQESIYRVELVLPVTNALHSPVRYLMQPQEQVDALFTLEERGLDLVAIYHSHLNGTAAPSDTDIAEARYPDVVHLIWSCQAHVWQCRGFLIGRKAVSEVPIQRQAIEGS